MIESAFTRVAPGDRQRAIDVLVTAFVSDPVIRWLYPEPHAYLTHFPEFLDAFGGKAFDEATVWHLISFTAVALWYPPHVEPDGDAVVAVIQATVQPDRQEDTFSVLEQMGAAHPTYPHWYLPWVGVDGPQQGKGLGAELMRHCLAIVDADHLPAYLESPNPRNLSFYERHGFEVTGQSQAGAFPPVFSMLRPAR